jgi:hypothetical protein
VSRSKPWPHEGLWRVGDTMRWRGVRLVCCRKHFAGQFACHPWDPGWGWSEAMAAQLWRPLRRRDRWLLKVVGRRTRGADLERAIRRDVETVDRARLA